MLAARRITLAIFVLHLAASLLLGYVVIPPFDTMVEPPPPPPPYAPALLAIIRVFYFPVISWAIGALVTGLSRPGLGFVLLNSALVATLLGLVLLMLRKLRGAVA